MAYKGFSNLRTVSDLYRKLCRDRKRLSENINDSGCVFDFLVTALHMLDWLYPDDRKKRSELEKNEVLLQICSHVANGAKHFEATTKKHQSVKGIGHATIFDTYIREEGTIFDTSFGGLYLTLDGTAKQKYGGTLLVEQLADELITFWHLKLSEEGLL